MVNMQTTDVKLAINNEEKPKRRRLRVGDPDFQPPDGGWGWLIVFACGLSNLSTFPIFQQFGLVFKGRFRELGITDTQTTTVINMNSAFNASVGLLNGPVFKTFTYRQVAMFGSLLVASSLFTVTFCQSFWSYLIIFSVCYGSGIGITQSSNALALNTYFREKRPIATGFSWSTTALGPIVLPYIITFCLENYDVEGTVRIFSAFALHAFMCSLLLQPVEWHTKFRDTEAPPPTKLTKEKKSISVFSSQYIKNEDDPHATGYEIMDPGVPMMVRSNDGWYSQNRSQAGSRASLSSNKINKSRNTSGQNSVAISNRPSYNNLSEARSKRNSSSNLTQDGTTKDRKKERRHSINKTAPAIREEAEEHGEKAEETEKLLNQNGVELLPIPPAPQDEKAILKDAAKKLAVYKEEQALIDEVIQQEELRKRDLLEKHDSEEDHEEHLTLWQKIYIFFDFDLFKDPIYVNLMMGITIANFAELNFSVLTPIILEEFKFGNYQIATFMSLLGATDILVRFFVPFLAKKIGWDNKTFFLIGVLCMAMGRVILVQTQTYPVGLMVAAMIGAGKGLRTIFMALVIPGYVPLVKLPAATGLQLAFSGLLFVVLGPVVGWVRRITGTYVATLHILNICTYSTAVAWILEGYLSSRKNRAAKKLGKEEIVNA